MLKSFWDRQTYTDVETIFALLRLLSFFHTIMSDVWPMFALVSYEWKLELSSYYIQSASLLIGKYSPCLNEVQVPDAGGRVGVQGGDLVLVTGTAGRVMCPEWEADTEKLLLTQTLFLRSGYSVRTKYFTVYEAHADLYSIAECYYTIQFIIKCCSSLHCLTQ